MAPAGLALWFAFSPQVQQQALSVRNEPVSWAVVRPEETLTTADPIKRILKRSNTVAHVTTLNRNSGQAGLC